MLFNRLTAVRPRVGNRSLPLCHLRVRPPSLSRRHRVWHQRLWFGGTISLPLVVLCSGISLTGMGRELDQRQASLKRLAPSLVRETETAAFAPLPPTENADDTVAPMSVGPADGPSSDGNPPEPEVALTLEGLQELAMVYHPAITRAQALANAARGNWLQVGLAPNPVVGYEGQQIGSNGLAEQDGVFVEQEFVRGGKLRLNRAVAGREVARADRELWIARQRVTTDVRLAFYDVAVAQRQVELTDQLTRIASDGLRSAKTLFAAKEVSKPDVLQAELEIEDTQIMAQTASNRYKAAWITLANTVGQPSLPRQRVEANLDDAAIQFEWETALNHLLSNSPEIAAASASVERARWVVERARAEPRPNVTVRGLINARDNGIGGDPDGGISVGLPVPVWNRNQGAISQAQCELVAAIRDLERLNLELQNRLAAVFEHYANSRNQVERYRQRILPAASESLELTSKSYQAGELDFISLLTAQRTFFQTSLSYLEAIRELRIAEAEIDGMLLSNALSAR